jgi:hypothetical protein
LEERKQNGKGREGEEEKKSQGVEIRVRYYLLCQVQHYGYLGSCTTAGSYPCGGSGTKLQAFFLSSFFIPVKKELRFRNVTVSIEFLKFAPLYLAY